MAMNPSGDRRGAMAEINVTPLVDVMLVLLIIFMVAAPMIQQGVDVNLPKIVATELPANTDLLIVSVNKTGSVYIGKTQIPMDQLAEKVEALYKDKADKEAFLRADKDVPYGVVVNVMSQMKRAGIEKLGMVTEPLEKF
ncbi:protein TolR [bacterium]|nr:MAG: protein TolR [bacterium]